MELKICNLYPDIMNLYGDRGNIICMQKRLKWRGIDVSAEGLTLGSSGPLSGYDLIFIGGGQETPQRLLLEELRKGRAAELKAAAEDGIAVLAICAGFQMLGNYYEDSNGSKVEYAGVLDMYTRAGEERITGNYSFKCTDEAGGSTAVGFENHSGRTYLGSSLSPLGKIIKGFGNNGDGSEGVHYKNVFGTYSYGPVLPKNPELCDFILLSALERKYGRAELAPLDDSAELLAHDEMLSRL